MQDANHTTEREELISYLKAEYVKIWGDESMDDLRSLKAEIDELNEILSK